jgi:hypothetical protein
MANMANRMFFFIALPGTIICFVAYTMVVFTPNYMTYTAPLPHGMKEGQIVHNYRMGAIQNCTKNGTFHATAVKAKKKALVAIVKRSLSESKVKNFEGTPVESEMEAEAAPAKKAAAKKAPAKKTAAKKAPAKKAAAKKAAAKKTATAAKKLPATVPKKVTYGKWDCSLIDWKMLTNQIFLAYISTTAVAWFTLLGAFFTALIKIILDWVPHDKIKAARILCSRNFGLGLMSAHITAGGFIIASTVLMVVLWKTSLAAAGWKLGFNIYLGIGVAVGSFFTAIMWFMDVKKMGIIPI